LPGEGPVRFRQPAQVILSSRSKQDNQALSRSEATGRWALG
jgi:hypothetical protein